MEKIAAVVVTYNRLGLVQRTISALQNQKRKLDAIIVIDNQCTDGTSDWLDKFAKSNNITDCKPTFIVIHQTNQGGAGGFWRGIKEAYERGYDWIWCMDDDVFPREDCLEQMLKHSDETIGILCPHRVMNGKTFTSESKIINLSNPFKNTFVHKLSKDDVEKNDITEIQGMAFEGPLIKREVVEKIGLPNKELFILYDDTDYSYRTILAGYRALIIRNAKMDKYCFSSNLSENDIKMANKWKIPYHIRNSAYFCHKYGKNILVREFGAMPFVIKMYFAIFYNLVIGRHKYKMSDIILYTKMVKKGKRHELGKCN